VDICSISKYATAFVPKEVGALLFVASPAIDAGPYIGRTPIH
jgi:hypothetical protein